MSVRFSSSCIPYWKTGSDACCVETENLWLATQPALYSSLFCINVVDMNNDYYRPTHP
jgi:hypothetical protein